MVGKTFENLMKTYPCFVVLSSPMELKAFKLNIKD
jgi:hypothetical protein